MVFTMGEGERMRTVKEKTADGRRGDRPYHERTTGDGDPRAADRLSPLQ
jgi:hypothetical protein